MIVALWLSAALLPVAGFAHIPLPPKEPTEIGRRVVNTAVPDFTLTDQDGKSFRFASSRGKLVLVTFVFTTCPDVCPLFTANFAGIQRSLDEKKINDKRWMIIGSVLFCIPIFVIILWTGSNERTR